MSQKKPSPSVFTKGRLRIIFCQKKKKNCANLNYTKVPFICIYSLCQQFCVFRNFVLCSFCADKRNGDCSKNAINNEGRGSEHLLLCSLQVEPQK